MISYQDIAESCKLFPIKVSHKKTFTADFLESFPLVFYWCSVNAVRRSNINRYNNTKPAYVIETVASWNLGASADLVMRKIRKEASHVYFWATNYFNDWNSCYFVFSLPAFLPFQRFWRQRRALLLQWSHRMFGAVSSSCDQLSWSGFVYQVCFIFIFGECFVCLYFVADTWINLDLFLSETYQNKEGKSASGCFK